MLTFRQRSLYRERARKREGRGGGGLNQVLPLQNRGGDGKSLKVVLSREVLAQGLGGGGGGG